MKIGLIYIIKSNLTDSVYIGSTTSKTVNIRFSKHKNNYKRYNCGLYNYFSAIEVLRYKDCYIEELDRIEYENKKDLLKLEGEYIKNNNNTVNILLPGRNL